MTSANGTFRTWRDVRLESVKRVKADIEFAEHALIGQPALTRDQRTLDFRRAVERTGPRVFRPKAKIQFFPGRKKSGRSSASCLSEKSASGLGILYDLHSRRAHFTA
jgi:hypothetical protein